MMAGYDRNKKWQRNDDWNDDNWEEPSCIVCGKENPNYKCPNCYDKYCSVKCCKTHKETGPCVKYDPEKEEHEAVTTGQKYREYSYPTQDTISRICLMKLTQGENLEKIKGFFQNKKIKSYIQILDSTDDPESEIKAMLKDPEFHEFFHSAMDIVTQPEDPTKSAYENYMIKVRKELMDFWSGK